MPGGYIGEADILVGADATGLAKDVQRQAAANLKAAGQQLGRDLSDSVAKSVKSTSGKIADPIAKAAQAASSAMKRPAQDLVAGFRSADAAASALTGRMGSLGGVAKKALTPAISQVGSLAAGYKSASAAQSSFTGALGTLGGVAAKTVKAVTGVGQSARSAFGGAVAAAQALPGPVGAFANVAVKAFSSARLGLVNFAAGFTSAQAGLSSFTGKLGSLGTIARSSVALVTSTLRTAIPSAARSAFNGLTSAATGAFNLLKAGASKAWEGLTAGAKRAAAAAGDALKSGLGGAARGAAVAIAGGVATMLGKGFARLNSLNQAEARLTGLGLAGEQLTSVMDSADKAVTGTAYSMADAAQAAGMMASAGIQAGSGMDDAMKALVATTAASGAEMSEITPIYTKIAAAGKVTGETMAQMLDRGINASGALQKSLGKTAEEVTAMVSSGEIDFTTFVEAINGDLSMLAASMGGTLGGMTANVLSAFGRIGAEVQKPIFDALLVAMPSVLDFTKRLATAVKEFMAPLQGQLTPLAENFAKILDGINFDAGGIGNFVAALGPLLPLLGAVVGVSGGLLADLPVIGSLFGGLSGPIGLAAGALAALTMVDPATMLQGFESISGFIASSLPGIMQSAIGVIQTGISNLVQNLPIMLGGITEILLMVLTQITATLPQVIPLLISAIGQMIPTVLQALLTALPLLLNAAFQLFGGLVTGLLQALPVLVSTLVAAIPQLITTLVDAIPLILDGALQMFMGILDALVVAVPQIITALVEALPTIISKLVEAIPKILDAAVQFFLGLVTGLANALPQIVTALVEAIPQLLQAIVNAIPQIIEAAISMFLGLVTGLAEAIPQILTAVVEMIPVLLEAIIGAIPMIIDAGIQLFVGLAEAIPEALPKIWEAITNDLLPGIWNAITGQEPKTKEVGKGVGESAAAGLSSSSTSFATAGAGLANTANSSLAAGSTAMTTTGAALGNASTAGLASTGVSMTTAASGLGTGAASALAGSATDMTTAASTLGQGAVTGLAGQTEATRGAASDLANAATVDVTAKVAETKTAGTKIAEAFAAGITSGKASAGTAAAGVASAAQASLSSTTGFISLGRSMAYGLSTGVQQGTPGVIASLQSLTSQAQTTLIGGVVTTIGSAFTLLWGSRVAPTLALMNAGFGASMQRIRDSWGGMIANLQAGFNSRLRPLLAGLSTAVLTGPPTAFARAVASITASWARIQEAAARPARFVIQTVMNGMIGAMNKIPGVNVPMLSAGFARGGILPGMSSMSNGDDQLIMARRGEGMMVSEALRTPADRSAFLAANAAGRRGVGFASLLNGYARGGLVSPLPRGSYTVSQPFHSGHNGIDLAAAMGTKVYAAAKGIVQLAQSVPMGGNEIYVQHDGIATRYSHLSAFAVKAGDAVRKNQTIGYVGSTGMSTGPHLHYMVHQPNDGGNGRGYGNIQNPSGYLGVYGTEVDGYMDELEAKAKSYTAQFAAAFSSSSMFNAAAGGLMGQGLKGILASARSSLGTDNSDGAEGRTGARSIIPKLYDNGGVIPHGGAGVNLSGKPEAVLTNSQWKMLAQLAQGFTSGSLGSSGIATDLANGLARGIASGSGTVGTAVSSLSGALVDRFRADLEIHSPSKVFERLGKYIGDGLKVGIEGTVAQTKSAGTKLVAAIKSTYSDLRSEREKLVKDQAAMWEKAREIDWSKNWDAAMKKAVKLDKQIAENKAAIAAIDKSIGTGKASKTRETALIASVTKQSQQLLVIAEKRALVAKQLQAANSDLEKAEDRRVGWANEIQSKIMDRASIINRSSIAGMAEVLTARIRETEAFQKKIDQLRKLGANADTLGDLTEQFAQTGSTRAADALLNGGAAGVKQIQDLQAQLAKTSGKLGTGVGNTLYKAGADAARGLIAGLESQEAALEKAAKKVADAITGQVKKTLKIKSPSRVTRALGVFTGDGVKLGLLDSVTGVSRAAGVLSSAIDANLEPAGPMARWQDPGLGAMTSRSARRSEGLTPEENNALRAIIARGGVGRSVVIEEGAIVVVGADDPAATSVAVLDAIAEELEG